MGAIDLPKSPNVFHPEKPSAVGSRNSLAQEGRDQQREVNQLLEEETNKVLHHINARLPKEVLDRIDVMGGLKEKLYNYFNQNYQNMFNRFMVTTEDEMVKKVRNFIDKEEMKSLSRYTPKEISELLDQIGGADKFNTGEVEKSMVNMFGHLQGHIQRGVNDLENLTNALLRQKTDVGAFIRGENAYSVVKCSFKDDNYKPKTVTNVKLSVNILDSELISPIFHYQVTVEYLIKDLISKHLVDQIDKEIEKLKDRLIDAGKEELTDTELIFERMNRVRDYTDDDADNPKSKRYSIIGKELMERISNLRAEIDPTTFDQLNIRENLKKIIDIENIRSRGYNTAVNSITSILDVSKMGYQYIENLKNARELILREYEDTDIAHLPDERYQLRLQYYDNAQLIEERKAFDVQAKSFETEVSHLWDVLEMMYEDSKFLKRITDFDDLAGLYRRKIRVRIKSKTGEPVYEDIAKVWDEISFVKPAETEVEKMNRSYLYEKDKIKNRLILMKRQAQEHVLLSVPDPAARRRGAPHLPPEGIRSLRLHDQPLPHPARPPPRRGHLLHQEEESHARRHGQRAQRVPPWRVQGLPGCRLRLLLPPPLHGARGHRPILLADRGRGGGGRPRSGRRLSRDAQHGRRSPRHRRVDRAVSRQRQDAGQARSQAQGGSGRRQAGLGKVREARR